MTNPTVTNLFCKIQTENKKALDYRDCCHRYGHFGEDMFIEPTSQFLAGLILSLSNLLTQNAPWERALRQTHNSITDCKGDTHKDTYIEEKERLRRFSPDPFPLRIVESKSNGRSASFAYKQNPEDQWVDHWIRHGSGSAAYSAKRWR